MKIGILTLPFNNNYGGYLQAYALIKVLKDMGHDPILINRRINKKTILFHTKYTCKQIVKSILYLKKYALFYNYEKAYRNRGINMLSFVNRYIYPQTDPIFSSKDLKKKCIGIFDACIVGSDQVWRPEYVPEIKDFFLRFLSEDNSFKIAYAASFGTAAPQYTHEQILECGKYLSKFKAVSLREDSGKNIIKKFGWTYPDVSLVLDPTMLLPKEHYFNLISSYTHHNVDYKRSIFCYVLDKSTEIENIIKTVSETLSLSPYNIIDTKRWNENDYKMPSIEEWLIGIKESAFVVTDSFHGTVFCILFNKPFFLYTNKERGSDRFSTLLKLFNLEDRIANEYKNFDLKLKTKINWDEVNTKIEEFRIKSLSFLSKSLYTLG